MSDLLKLKNPQRHAPAKQFAEAWVSMLWRAMQASGKGYRVPSMKHTGRGEYRRSDKLEAVKLGEPQWLRRYKKRYA